MQNQITGNLCLYLQTLISFSMRLVIGLCSREINIRRERIPLSFRKLKGIRVLNIIY